MSIATFKITWKGPKGALDKGAFFLSEVLDPPAEAVALTRCEHDDKAPNHRYGSDGDPSIDETLDESGTWSLEAYFFGKPDEPLLHEKMKKFAPAFANVDLGRMEELENRDWVAHSLGGLGVVEAGRFVLYGIHDADKVTENDDTINIQIDANQAFGTGHHPTTSGCLTLLSRFVGANPGSILDLGCGSGVLAIAAAKIWDTEVLAVDIDQTSIEIARENAKLNGVSDKIRFEVSNGFDHKAIRDAAPFDFTFANILAGPLIELAPEMAANANAFGRIMLAGLLSDQEQSVEAAYVQAGFKRINRLNHNSWPVLLYVRP
ncbi:MAG: 50S ribosomal protein L11 methyltransferase [Pseudomonadota bacterium]